MALRILHILDHSIPQSSGYAMRTLAILREQREIGWVTFHLTGPRQGGAHDLSETVDGWTFLRTPSTESAPHVTSVAREVRLMLVLLRRTRTVIDEVRPDIVHAHSPVLDALPALLAARERRLPVVYEVRAFWEDAAVSHGTARADGLRYRASRWTETRVLRRVDAITTICQGLRDDIVGRGIAAEKVTIIPNAVDVSAFRPFGTPDAELVARWSLGGKTVLGFFGSFFRYEGLHYLIAAMQRLAHKAPQMIALLAGLGPEEQRLKDLISHHGLGSRVLMLGRVPHARIGDYYNLCDMMVYPRESIPLTERVTPLKPLEAMAAGKIVVASDVGGHRELIRDGETGYLFRPDDPESLAERVIQAASDREAWPAMRARARRFIETERNWRASVERYRDVYARALAAR